MDEGSVLVREEIRTVFHACCIFLVLFEAAVGLQKRSDVLVDCDGSAAPVLGRTFTDILACHDAPGAADRKHTAVLVCHDEVVPFQCAQLTSAAAGVESQYVKRSVNFRFVQ